MKPKILIPLLLLAITAIAPITAMADDTDAYVAQIEDKKYKTLKEAADAANLAGGGKTITMIANCSITNDITIKFTVEATLDLNGKTIYCDYDRGGGFIDVGDNGNLTITDSNTESTGTITSNIVPDKNYLIFISTSGKLTIKNGNFIYDQNLTGNKGCRLIGVNSKGTLQIDNGTFRTSGAYIGAIWNQGTTIINNATITNTCTTATSAYSNPSASCIHSYLYGKNPILIINGGTFTSNLYAIYVGDGTYSLSSSATYNGKISINGNETLVLSDNVAFKDIATSATYPQISYTRTGAKTWGTVCLPFVPDEDESVSYYSLNKLDRTTGTIDVTEVSHDNMKANTPYLFFLNSSANGTYTAKAENVTLNNEQNPGSVSIDNWKLTGVYAETAVFAANTDKYKSTTSDKVVEPSAYYIKDNKICPINTYFRLKPYRAYFVMDSGDKGTGSNSYQVAILDELTGIGSAGNENEAKEIVGIYNLLGQKQSSLQKGINIVHYSDGTSKTINVSSR